MGDQEDFSQLPLQEQFIHKNWKARKGGYETAAKEFKTAQSTDPIVKDFTYDSSLWKGAVADSNVAAQQEALAAYNAFLDIAGVDGARRTRSGTIQPIVEKGLTGRPAAKAAALEALLLLIELDKPDPVIEELIPLVSVKLPKVIVAALSALREIYCAYGCKTVEPKPVLKILPKAYGHADKNVRAEAQALTVELYRWLREAMKPLFWSELKDVQQKDLEKLFEPIRAEPPPKQERLLRSQQAAREAAEAAAVDEQGGDEEEEEAAIDLEPEFEAVDVMPKIPKDFQDRLASSKWKDRKEVLEEVFAIVNVPAIQEGQFDDLVRGCAKSMKDANIQVVAVAANIIECLAKGLRRKFGRYKGTILSPMLERFKEKKQSVTDALAAACDAVFAATSLGDVQSETLEALKNKNPQVKEHSAKFLIRSLKTTREVPTPEQTKELVESAKKLLGESAPALRDAGAEILGVLWKILTDRNMLNHLEGLDDIRKNKIKEFCDAAEVRAKWKPKAAPAPKPAASAPAARKPAATATRRPGGPGVKKPTTPAPRKVTSPDFLEEPPSQPRLTSKPATTKPGGLRPPGGLKAPSGLAKPGGLKAPGSTPTSGAASPKRQGMVLDEAPALTARPTPGPGRGLAGRPLGRPPAMPASPPPAPRQSEPTQSALSQIERQELSDLRQEVEVMRQQASDLLTDKMKLTSAVAELQNQNAQLIEDNTRDVLQIKAKETQLVRARSDAEASEERANSLSHEIDRLKREMSRLHRAQQTQSLHNTNLNGGKDSPIEYSNGNTPSEMFPPAASAAPRSGYSSTRGFNVASPNKYAGSEFSNGDKENVPEDRSHPHSKFANHSSARPMSAASSGRATLSSTSGDRDSGALSSGTNDGVSRSSHSGGAAEGGVESWKRAAEVTQNLKARIEMMKARQNIGRGQ